MNILRPINWGSFYMICVGMMNMRPKDFWDLSPREMYLAIKGFKQFNGSSEKETQWILID
jgi:hypothetical protein